MIIYKTTNIINNKVYIGQKTGEHKGYLGGGVLIRKAIKEFGRSNFKHEIITQGDFNQEFTNYLEKHYIRLYNSTDPNTGYNLMIGGKSNTGHSAATIAKMSAAKIGNTWNKGRKPSALNAKMVQAAAKLNTIDAEMQKKMQRARLAKGVQNIRSRRVEKIAVFKVLADRAAGIGFNALKDKYQNLKPAFISKLIYVDKFYKDWKSEFLNERQVA